MGILGIVCFVALFWMTACGGASSSPADPMAPAPTATLATSSGTVNAGQSVTLTWTSTNATSVMITPSVSSTPLALSGSATVTPQSTTTYNMTATGKGGTAAAAATVTVSAASSTAPAVTLSAAYGTITSGTSTTLTWTSSNATSVSISPSVSTAALGLSGSATVNPAATTTYTITATNGAQSATATQAVTVVPPGTPVSPITHLIVLVMQNHGYDNLFGTFPGGNGLNPALPSYTQVDASGNTVTPTLLSSLTTNDLNHDATSYTAAWDNGKMDKYAFTNGDLSMQYFDNTLSGTAKDGKTFSMSQIWGYAQNYALADNFFASAMSSEPANMLYMDAATIDNPYTAGKLPYYDKCSAVTVASSGGKIEPPLTETNLGNQLNAANVSWAWSMGNFATSIDGTCVDYVPQENPFQYFTSTEYSANLTDFTMADFINQLNTGTLPSVLFITPPPVASMHPGAGDLSNGLEWLDSLITNLQRSNDWPSTAVVLLFDESGGWYDHVPPPQLADASGLGARVPVIVISPFAKAGTISHQQMDFVSILRFVQWNWGLGMFQNAAQAAREKETGDLCDLLTSACGAPQ